MKACKSGDKDACYRVIYNETDRIISKLKEQEKKDNKKEKKDKESGVSSGCGYRLSHGVSSGDRDKVESNRSYSRSDIKEAEELGVGVFVIMRTQLDPNLSDHQLSYIRFETSQGFLVYVWNHRGYMTAPFLAPGVFERHIPYHGIVFRDEINFRYMVANGLTYHDIIVSKYPNVGNFDRQW